MQIARGKFRDETLAYGVTASFLLLTYAAFPTRILCKTRCVEALLLVSVVEMSMPSCP